MLGARRWEPIVRWLLWIAIGGLLLFRAGTMVGTADGELVFGPAVFSAGLLIWAFVTATVIWRRVNRRRRR